MNQKTFASDSTPTKSRLAFLTPFLHHQGIGGIQRWLMSLCSGLVKSGVTVDLLVNARSINETDYDIIPGTNLINLGYHKWRSARELVKYLKVCQPQGLIAAGYRYNTQAAIAKHFVPSQKIYLSVHENVSAGSKRLAWYKRMFRYPLMRYLYPNADGIIAVSQGVADDIINLLKIDHKSVQVIYNPVNIEDIKQLSEHPVLSEYQDFSKPYLVAVGRLEEQKDYPTLLRAFVEVRKYLDLQLVILGKGMLEEKLKALAKQLGIFESVFFIGLVENPFPLIRDASCLVLSSKWEGLSMVLIEAMVLGTPVVSTDCPSGPREVLAGGQYGPLVTPGDAAALATAIVNTLHEPPQAELLIERSRFFVQESIVEQYLHYLGLNQNVAADAESVYTDYLNDLNEMRNRKS